MGALPTLQTAIGDRAHLVGIPAPEHLVHEAIIVAAIVPRMDALKSVPVFSKDLFEDAPSWRSCCSHQAASLQGVGLSVVALFYHMEPITSTLSAALPRAGSPPLAPPGTTGTSGQPVNGNPSMLPLLSSPFPHFFPSLISFLECLDHIVLIVYTHVFSCSGEQVWQCA